ncbi:MAG: hypothetical protein JWR09_190 [Mucilaginibacter sp.]|nr:hypothetical protein [Mucilaginibacter sp.]
MDGIEKPHLNWTSKIVDNELVSIDTYKFIFEQAEKRFEDILSERENVTDKTIKILTAAITFSGFITGIMIQHKFYIPPLLIIITAIAILFSLVFCLIVLHPKKARNRGLPPIASTPSGLGFANTSDTDEMMVYYNSICVLQDNITLTLKRNEERVVFYKVAQWSFLALILIMAVDLSYLL